MLSKDNPSKKPSLLELELLLKRLEAAVCRMEVIDHPFSKLIEKWPTPSNVAVDTDVSEEDKGKGAKSPTSFKSKMDTALFTFFGDPSIESSLTAFNSDAMMELMPSVPLDVEMVLFGASFQDLTNFHMTLDLALLEDLSVLLRRACESMEKKEVKIILSREDVGKIVAARYPVDKKWYRCQVLSVKEDEILLRYIDYGNENPVHPSKILPLPKCVDDIPIAGIRCSLHRFNESLHGPHREEILEAIHSARFEAVPMTGIFKEVIEPPRRAEDTAFGVVSFPKYSLDIRENGKSVLETILYEDMAGEEDFIGVQSASNDPPLNQRKNQNDESIYRIQSSGDLMHFV